MGVSTDGQLTFGFAYEEGEHTECFPWERHYVRDTEEDEEDEDEDEEDSNDSRDSVEEWWKRINGYKPPFELYAETKTGYIDGKTRDELKDKIDEYHQHRRKWEDANPLPVLIESHCSHDYPMYLLAVPDHHFSNSRGTPVEIENLDVDPDALKAFWQFIKDHKIKLPEGQTEPKWWLTSMWG